MNLKGIVTLALLVFVGVSVLVLVARNTDDSENSAAVSVSEQPLQPDFEANAVQEKVAVYYFHYNRRCATCNRIEEFARKAVENRFANEVNNGILVFKSMNVEEQGNQHFETDYSFAVQSLILVDGREGRVGEWKNLKNIWELVWKEQEYLDYVQTEIREFLERN